MNDSRLANEVLLSWQRCMAKNLSTENIPKDMKQRTESLDAKNQALVSVFERVTDDIKNCFKNQKIFRTA
ncbi:hypothetical protein DFR58_102117 [Anaerobacterium chartisolvens]|uniref:Uncharacterized protein n=1 Tax=Anaerobacterium chartisolvens TaxID=1297424 RepID=A0A369BHJ6_9FIRM|nr:hypothetical protein [Anaerobacterium chartisolvens]RCX20048.1 hypothetical protein DFR58_102117 [Anaerobacterium chartisolvens]